MTRAGRFTAFRGERWLIVRTWSTTDRLILLENTRSQRRILTTEGRITADQEARTRDSQPPH